MTIGALMSRKPNVGAESDRLGPFWQVPTDGEIRTLLAKVIAELEAVWLCLESALADARDEPHGSER